MVTMPEDSVVVGCAGPGNGKKCPAKLVMTRDELREINDKGDSVRCPGCERKRKEGGRKAAGRTTILDTVLRAVADIHCTGDQWCLVPEVVVAAWTLDKQGLGLSGMEAAYPDSNKVAVALVHLVKQGLLCRPHPRHVALTEAGSRRVLAERRKPA